ncbi:MAG: DUF1800 domain-containing protein [Acidobacteria bacterium]|nr:DUF1800 domain-containing protein [Acidobacteriota bacterium]
MFAHRHQPAIAILLSLVLITGTVPPVFGKKKEPSPLAGRMADSQRALHALNRLTFGPRVGDVQRVLDMGVERWIEAQLHPEKLDDSALEARLAPLRTLRMSTREIVEDFPPPELIRAVADGKQAMPSDAARHAIYMAQLERYEKRQQKKQEAANTTPVPSMETQPGKMTPSPAAGDEELTRRQERLEAEARVKPLLDLPPEQRMKGILQASLENPRTFALLRGDTREQLLQGLDAKQQETVLALNNPQQVVADELMEGKMLRALYSERQLLEVMDDFWLNHFNVFLGKGADRYLLTAYEREVIRPHALGKFEDLLLATAKSPAMLFYLDNWLSVGPNSDFANGIPRRGPRVKQRRTVARKRPQANAKGKRSGLNENYGRELMELHTLGVNGGYSQKDVTEVARVFTGWTMKQPHLGGEFQFDERMHEPGDKIVLGHRIKGKGEKEGLEVLHILARHPATAHFVCSKLAQRFVSDDPPRVLVDRMAQTFLKKNGDIREVLRTMFTSPEFWAPEAYRAKVKTPLEFVVSAARASNAEVSDAMPLVRQLQNLGMPLYGMQPPTGYSMKADAWVNSSALLGRMNFAMTLASGKIKGVKLDLTQTFALKEPSQDTAPQVSNSEQTLALLENILLAGEISPQTHQTIAAQLEDPKITQRKLDDPARPPNIGAIAGLLLGSPEFQKR